MGYRLRMRKRYAHTEKVVVLRGVWAVADATAAVERGVCRLCLRCAKYGIS